MRSLLVVQPNAFQCWSSRTSTGQTSSTVRGRSLKSDSTTREATTGSATNCCINWRGTAATRWESTWRHMASGTGPSTVRSRYAVRCTATSYWYPGTRVTLVMRSLDTTIWCSPRTTVTTTRGTTRHTTTTVPCTTAADSGTRTAPVPASTPFAVVEMASDGIHRKLSIAHCRRHACGWRARSLHWLSSDDFVSQSWRLIKVELKAISFITTNRNISLF